MKYFKLLSLLVLTALLGSCTTVQKTASTVPVETYVVQYPTVADLDISHQKVSKSTSWFSLFSFTSPILRRDNLIAELIQENDADVLVEPHFIFTNKTFGRSSITVFGYPATFKNFRKATESDLEALRCGRRDIYDVSNSCPRHEKKKDKKNAKKGKAALSNGLFNISNL